MRRSLYIAILHRVSNDRETHPISALFLTRASSFLSDDKISLGQLRRSTRYANDNEREEKMFRNYNYIIQRNDRRGDGIRDGT